MQPCKCFCLLVQPTWYPYLPLNGQYLEVSVSYPASIWPWSGYVAVRLSVAKAASMYSGTAEGHIAFTVTSPASVSVRVPQPASKYATIAWCLCCSLVHRLGSRTPCSPQ